ncbi:hypothetical protein JCM30471_12290 [Desulfuromonas carbonis]|uniref:FixH family protein n=1 Tax=Desulfuromonas sp. DDH964 TaxID=1823759 RepID=UPI00078DF4C1|nr:FixH family protein [Desulfuromonas sp. DDH964]AMV72713.1 hypothetical protein DBW_2376 [Desulfuromonas sp. DDH964]
MKQVIRRRHWQPLLTILIVLFLALTAWAIDQARQKGSAVSDQDYYRHGLAYNENAGGSEAGATGSWSLTFQLDGTLLEIRLQAADGSSVSGAKGEIVLLGSRPGAMKRFDLFLTEGDPGQYLVRLPEGLDGQVMAQLTLEKGSTSLHRSLLLNF